MKKLTLSLLTLLCLLISSCSKPDYKALAQKATDNPTELTQQDYSDMLDYMDSVIDKAVKLSPEEQEKLLMDDNEPYMAFNMVVASANYGLGEEPELNAENKEKYKKMVEKIKKMDKELQGE